MTKNPAPLTLDQVLAACAPGGASVLTSVTELAPAVGPHATVAPPRYVKGKEATYSFSRRAIDGEAKMTVLLDSKGSQANRREDALVKAMKDESHPAHAAASRIPHLELRFNGELPDGSADVLYDMELPHRWVDGHVRAGTREGKSVTQDPTFRAMRNSTPHNVRPIFDVSPSSLVDGVWDSSRKTGQVRLRSAIVSEIFGVLADQELDATNIPLRGGARVDPIAASVQLDGKRIVEIADRQKDELSAKTYANIVNKAKSTAKGKNSGSVLGLGAVPPTLENLGGVACTRITRSTVLSFATLRQLRFGGSPEQDTAFRAVLATMGLLAMALADAELYLRADCDLIETAPSDVRLDGRYGQTISIAPLSPEHATELFEAALEHAAAVADLDWHGQVFEVIGDATILEAAADDSDGEGE